MSIITIHHGAEDLNLNIVTVDNRYVDISVNHDLSIDMRVPIGMEWDMIEKYVRMNEQAICQAYERKKLRNRQVMSASIELEDGHIFYRNGQKLPFLGNMNLSLHIKYTANTGTTQIYAEEKPDGNRNLIIRTDNDNQNFLRYCVMRYYKKCADKIVKQKVYDFSRQMNLKFNHVRIIGPMERPRTALPGITHKNIEIKNQATLWGSCNKKRNLKFDWKLAMLPMEIIEYIIVHELTHLKKMNHSESFWMEIEKIMPEYKECQSWLNKHGKEYEIF